MGMLRRLKQDERGLLVALIAGEPKANDLLASLGDAIVEEMEDGGMGGLLFYRPDDRPRRLGKKLVEKEFVDIDGVPVMVAVNLDDHGELYELDIWKVDFSPLKRFPPVIK
ncbi:MULTISPECIES: DUF6984 family protein [Burkholderia]|uniref:DUF6984 domain-containing protein n=1 Tax=Burkholderia sola TaxID=2843302 RepID=A0ABV2C3E5_9BURK|nr:hypothetical protein [Burkholderia sp. CpTa8-5]MBP0605700.1 hypothetical protein [Burkholderia sp. CpTa8-5]